MNWLTRFLHSILASLRGSSPITNEASESVDGPPDMNPKAILMVKAYEALRLKAYRDAVGVWTIGYGHTGPEVVPGLVWTEAQCDEALAKDMAWARDAVRACGVSLTENEEAALISLVFNIGAGAFRKSTVRRKLLAGDKKGAADAFRMWNKGTIDGKKVTLRGLTSRREKEREIFLA